MKIIDLLNKIANGEELPKRLKYDGQEYKITKILLEDNNYYFNYINEDMECVFPINTNKLNYEVEILEEEKKIPEKLPYYSLEKIQKAKNKDEWREERISLLEKRVNDLHIKMNDLLDYLKSKGE